MQIFNHNITLYLTIIFISIFALIIVNKSYSTLNFLNEPISKNKRKIHDNPITRLGGISILSYLLIWNEFSDIFMIYFFSIIVFLIGFIDDLSQKISFRIRFILLLISIITFVFFNNYANINYENFNLIHSFEYAYYFALIFSIFGLLICINGFNFIDGLNGLTLGTGIIILIHYSYFASIYASTTLYLSIAIIFSIFPLFLVNISFGKIFAGDGAAYCVGFLTGVIGILLFNQGVLEAFHVACILFYPAIEVIFTFLRRLVKKRNPFKPDQLHLHTLIYTIVSHYIDLKSIRIKRNYLNSIMSLIIIFFISVINVMIIYFSDQINFKLLYFLLNISYLLIYYFFYRAYKVIQY
jgi:UDP-N-acetylmuramyl pentapeptide phosphotransferase/UDP-N-acetylglucosamine-1-phosphate transferase